MKDTIYREDAIKAMEQRYQDILRIFKRKVKDGEQAIALDMIGCIKSLPSADRPQGKWLLKDNVFHCGCCGKESHFTADDVYVYDMPLPDFCEKCGARLKGADDE